jgi:hypothetical protein
VDTQAVKNVFEEGSREVHRGNFADDEGARQQHLRGLWSQSADLDVV